MKNLFILFILLFSLSTYSQEKAIEDVEFIEASEKRQEDHTKEVSFTIIENVPVYKGCDMSKGNAELKNCMSTSISKHIAENFNTKIANGLGLPNGIVRINVIFKIDTEGNIIDVKSRAPFPALEEEAIRVIKLIPQMDKPGYQKGKAVIVPYALPIVFVVDNSKNNSKNRK